MKKTIALLTSCLLAGFVLGACTEPKARAIAPDDVTNAELNHLKECTALLMANWPAKEKVWLTSIVRDGYRAHTIGVNFSLSMNQRDIDALVAKGMNNQGYCEYKNDQLSHSLWIENVSNPAKQESHMASGYGRFK